jgi:ankyrin repeat protein
MITLTSIYYYFVILTITNRRFLYVVSRIWEIMSSEDSNKKLDAEEVLANLTPSEIHSEELFTAAFNGDTSEVKRLITIGANVNATEKDGNTPLHIASSWGHIDVVKLLVDKGANVNAKQKVFGDTPLHWASLSGRIDVLELLVAKGAAVNAETKNGETPLHWASANIDVNVVKLKGQM